MMSSEDEPGADPAGTLSVENAGPVVQHGDLELSGGLVAGRDLTVHGPVNVLADDGAPFGDHVTRPGRASDLCPYPGLDAFDEGLARYFHGRERDVDAVLALLRRAPLVAVVGSSGSGKSSLLSAGVLPALADGAVAGSAGWTVSLVRPGTQPVERLSAALAKHTGADGPTIWVIDQLEEVFDPAVDPGDRAAFLAAVAGPHPSAETKVLLALRSDFYPHLDQAPALAAAVSKAQHRVLPMGPQAIREVIEKPADQVGLRVEPELIDRMLADTSAAENALPLLSYALAQTWRRRRNGWLTLAEYAKAGALDGAIDHAAELVWESLTDRQRATARRMMLRLSHLGENAVAVRRQARLEDLVTDVDDETAVREVADRLAAARILTADLDTATEAPIVDITHETVLRAWNRLRTWLTEDREAKRAQDDLSSGAAAWKQHGADPGYLLRGARLTAIQAARRADSLTVNDVELRFLSLSSRLEHRQRWRSRLLGLLAAALAVAVAITFVVVSQQRRISREKTVADAVSLAARSRSVSGQERDLGALLAVAGARIDDNAVTRAAVMDAVSAHSGPLAYLLPAGRRATAVASGFTRDGSAIVGTIDGAVCALSPADGHETGPCFTGHHTNISAVTTDGDLVAAADATGLTTLHRQGNAAPVRDPVRATSAVVGLAVSPAHDQLLAATRFGAVERWRLGGEAAPLPPLAQSADVVALAVADKADQVVALTTAGELKRWRLTDGAELPALAEPGTVATGTTMRLAVVGDTRVVTADENRLGVWDLRGGQPPLWTDALGGTAVVSSGDGETVFVGSDTGTITSWRLAPAPLAVEPTRPGLVKPVVALGSGGDFLVGADQDGRVISWDLSGKRSPAGTPLAQASGPLQAVARNPAGAVASGGADGVVRVTRDGSTMDTHTFEGSVVGLAWQPTGMIAVGTDRGTLYELDPGTGATRTVSDRPGTAVTCLVADGRGNLVAGFSDGHVLFTDLPGAAFTAAKGSVSAIALSADGNRVAVASGDGISAPPQISVAGKRERFRDILTVTGHALPVTSLAFSPDGRTLASGSDDRSIRLWGLADGTTKSTFQGHTDMVLALVYSPDGTTLASGSQDGTLRLWDVASGLQIGRQLEFGVGYVWSLAPSPDGANLVAAQGSTVVEWPFGKGAWLDRACRLAGRLLTDDERKRYLPDGTSLRPCA
ncbi:WD40 repeat domain-containing protein [Amycolatopsis azurea]|uniref:Novel STAND NTPase 1 domain-containing protein n=1 Tax=Amycolatopsis azurea DSM 43854 TaxID=1238180 RepID=M2PIE8_9PSEU|nr:WD40 repeat domain-containing protein [Amycolatopsis azurea]EMD24213.1 hypothetical protein C791_6291 [Amycolatopsis azurea DSM 43854]OOC07965.1 hypothetical protein B0293_03505 [Amycolatopsis azurea DSM 43854]